MRVALLAAGVALVATGVAMGLHESRMRGMRAWDRPSWALSRGYRFAFPAARRVLLGAGLIAIAAASLVAAATTAAVLLLGTGWLAWAGSDLRAARAVERDLRSRLSREPSASVAEGLRVVLTRRHPEWGSDLVERIVADQETPAAVARVVVRLERK